MGILKSSSEHIIEGTVADEKQSNRNHPQISHSSALTFRAALNSDHYYDALNDERRES
jgi:hypothetical protein